ncbi:hypothetical protein WKI68_10450 [Streptomyces sp. MS1.HAVA.3]|uniref:Secreted protein n=1 Tax=Streptomyces caledonius TaxID=3134107 RepID=A0ABU8U255_9ACTN
MARSGGGPSVSAYRMSSLVAICQATSAVATVLRWMRRAAAGTFRGSRSRISLRRASAASAATVIPCPYTGLNRQAASPSTTKPAGQRSMRS